MSTLPSLIIVADRGHVIAYERQGFGSFHLAHSTDIKEGLQKISEQVTDQSGRFPNQATNGKGSSAPENQNLKTELELQTFRKIGEQIRSLLNEHHPDSWGFAAPSEINNSILKGLDYNLKRDMTMNVKLDLTGMPVQQVVKHFSKYAEDALPVSSR